MLLGASALDYITGVRTAGWVAGRVGFLIKKLSYLWNVLLNEVTAVAVNLQQSAASKNCTDEQQTSIYVCVGGLANCFPHPFPGMFERRVPFPALPPTHLVMLDASRRTRVPISQIIMWESQYSLCAISKHVLYEMVLHRQPLLSRHTLGLILLIMIKSNRITWGRWPRVKEKNRISTTYHWNLAACQARNGYVFL